MEIRGNHKKGRILLSTVSGVLTTKEDMIRLFDKSVPSVDVITTKSFQLTETEGNRPPVVTSPKEGDYGNSVGLRNPGADKAEEYIKRLKGMGMRALLNISLAGNRKEDFLSLVKRFDPYADFLELNFSCPHAAAGFGASIGSDENTVREYVSYITNGYKERKSMLLVKLTPNVDNIAQIAKAAIEAGADGISAINTVGPREYYHDGHPILFNKLGGKGGASGEWVKEIALEKVRQIREAIGDEPVILGMGGVTTHEDALNMVCSGADIVGVGSASATVAMKDYEAFFSAIKNKGEDSRKYQSRDRSNITYVKHKIIDKYIYSPDTYILTLDGKSECQAGQFVFLWHPEYGERPFSVAKNDPLTFIIKVRGEFTSALMNVNAGDDIYVRGLCGAPLEVKKTKKAILLGGGTGIVVLNLLASRLAENGTKMDIRLGLPSHERGKKGLLEDELKAFGSYRIVSDDGVAGRVICSFDKDDVDEDTAVYIVGPSIMMKKASEHFLSLGVPSSMIFLSMEKMTLCGIGMCGECSCGGKLTCKEGTFFSLEYLEQTGAEY